jgi:hypothetical protein
VNTPPAADSGAALAISIIALCLSGLAAVFAGWQALIAHGARNDDRRVHFSLMLRTNGPKVDWRLANAGKGTALQPTVVIHFKSDLAQRSFIGKVQGDLIGGVDSPLLFDKMPPNPNSHMQGHEGIFARDLCRASVSYRAPGSRRLKTQQVDLP